MSNDKMIQAGPRQTSRLRLSLLLRTITVIALVCCIATAQESSPEMAERSKELQAEQLSVFLDAYGEAIGKLGEIAPNKTQAFFLIPSMNTLWKGNKLVGPKFSDAVARLWRIPADRVRKFQSMVAQASQDEVSIQSALVWLVQIDRLYTKNDLSTPDFDRYIHRMSTTPIAAIQQWAAAKHLEKLDALFQLASVDDAYPNEQFSVPVFNKLLSQSGMRP